MRKSGRPRACGALRVWWKGYGFSAGRENAGGASRTAEPMAQSICSQVAGVGDSRSLDVPGEFPAICVEFPLFRYGRNRGRRMARTADRAVLIELGRFLAVTNSFSEVPFRQYAGPRGPHRPWEGRLRGGKGTGPGARAEYRSVMAPDPDRGRRRCSQRPGAAPQRGTVTSLPGVVMSPEPGMGRTGEWVALHFAARATARVAALSDRSPEPGATRSSVGRLRATRDPAVGQTRDPKMGPRAHTRRPAFRIAGPVSGRRGAG